jgi:hypothetical protein
MRRERLQLRQAISSHVAAVEVSRMIDGNSPERLREGAGASATCGSEVKADRSGG